MSDPAKYSLSNDIFLVRGEAGYLVFIMLKAREACELIQGVTQDSFIASYACRRDVVNCLRDICEAAKRISKQLRNSVPIHWQALDEVIVLDWQDANAVWDLAANRLNDLASSIKSLKPVFASNFVAYDSLKLAAGTVVSRGSHLSFFHDEPGDDQEPATNHYEAELADWLLQDNKVKEWIGSASGLSTQPVHRTGVPISVIGQGGQVGDIDALLFDTDRLEEAVAIECKRLKASVRSGISSINGLNNIRKGVRQANTLHKLGFSRTWLAIIVIVDGRRRTENNFLARGLPKTDFENVFKRTYEYALQQEEPLLDHVGIIFIEIVQPKDKPIADANFVSVCICREPVAVPQCHQLNIRLHQVLEASSAGGAV